MCYAVSFAHIDYYMKGQISLDIGQWINRPVECEFRCYLDNYIGNLTDLCKTKAYWTFTGFKDCITNADVNVKSIC